MKYQIVTVQINCSAVHLTSSTSSLTSLTGDVGKASNVSVRPKCSASVQTTTPATNTKPKVEDFHVVETMTVMLNGLQRRSATTSTVGLSVSYGQFVVGGCVVKQSTDFVDAEPISWLSCRVDVTSQDSRSRVCCPGSLGVPGLARSHTTAA